MQISMMLIILGIIILLVVAIVLFVVYSPKQEEPIPPTPPVPPTPGVVPDPPTDVLVLPGFEKAIIIFTPPVEEGSSPIISYTVTSSPGGYTATGSSSPVTITGLTNGTNYTFTVVATNDAGNSLPSLPSTSNSPTDARWENLGINFDDLNGNVYAILVVDTIVYVGGNFTTAAGTLVNSIAKFDIVEQEWSALGSGLVGVNGNVRALAIDSNGDILVGGNFAAAGGILATGRIARWTESTSTWSRLGIKGGVGGGASPVVHTIKVIATDVFLGGVFTAAGMSPTVAVNNIVQWDGSGYTPLTSGCNDIVRTLEVDSFNNLYIGGDFTSAGGVTNTYRIAKWNTSTSLWTPMNIGLNGPVFTIAISDTDDIYVGGSFTSTSNPEFQLNGISQWNSTSNYWMVVPNGFVTGGLNGSVLSIVTYNSDIYVGGAFTAATDNPLPLNKVTRWNGTSWEPLYTGLEGGNVLTLSIGTLGSDDFLITGGSFTTAGEEDANNIAYYGPLP